MVAVAGLRRHTSEAPFVVRRGEEKIVVLAHLAASPQDRRDAWAI
jgi:hypothetical protein